MRREEEWIKILVECKDNVQNKIRPLLKTLDQTLPNLGVGAGGDPIKKIDIAAENAIVTSLRRNKITFTLISEESGIVEYGVDPNRCYVTADPIDGTTNLIRGAPFYATSIAVSTKPDLKMVHTSLVANLCHDTTYTAQKGCGAFRDKKRIAPSRVESIAEGVIGIDLNGYRVRELVPRLTALMAEAKHLRHFGANALELCYVADGTTDAFIDIRGKLRTTDVAAAWLIVGEAGGIMTTPEGKSLEAKLDPKEKVEFVAAANEKIHRRILDQINTEKEAR